MAIVNLKVTISGESLGKRGFSRYITHLGEKSNDQ